MSSSTHLKALLNKNWILWKRSWCCSCAEIIIPALFAFLFVAFRAASPIEDVPLQTFTAEPYHYKPSYAAINEILIKDCFAEQNGGAIGLAPPGDYVINKLDSIFTGTLLLL